MVDGNYPSLEELDSDFGTLGNRIYSVGYLLAEYIVEGWGMESLRDLIRTNRDLRSVLGVGVEEFEIGWYTWVEAKYFSIDRLGRPSSGRNTLISLGSHMRSWNGFYAHEEVESTNLKLHHRMNWLI